MDELIEYIVPLIKLSGRDYPIIKSDMVFEWIKTLVEQYEKQGRTNISNYVKAYLKPFQKFIDFIDLTPEELLKEDFDTRIETFKSFKSFMKPYSERTIKRSFFEIKSFYKFYGFLIEKHYAFKENEESDSESDIEEVVPEIKETEIVKEEIKVEEKKKIKSVKKEVKTEKEEIEIEEKEEIETKKEEEDEIEEEEIEIEEKEEVKLEKEEIILEKSDPELTKRYLGERKDRKLDLRKKIETDIKSMEFEDIQFYLKQFFYNKKYFSIKIFVKYLLSYVLGIDSENGNYVKYSKQLSYKFVYIEKILEKRGFITPYDTESYKILSKSIETINPLFDLKENNNNSVLLEKIKTNIDFVDVDDIFPYLEEFFLSQKYFSVNVFISYLLTVKLGFESKHNKVYIEYKKKLNRKFGRRLIAENLLKNGFIEKYNSQVYRILNKNIEKKILIS